MEFNRALGYAYDALVKGPYPFDAMSTWKGLSERVAQGIYMGQGLLLPHTRVSGLQEPLMAFVVAREGITGIKTRNDEKAQFMCVLLSPDAKKNVLRWRCPLKAGMTKTSPLEATDGISAVAFKVSEESCVACSKAEPFPWSYAQCTSKFLVAKSRLFVQELFVHGAFGRVQVLDVPAEGGVFGDCAKEERSLDEVVCGGHFGMDFLAVRAEVTTKALGIACVCVSVPFVMRINPGFNARVFKHPVEIHRANFKVVASDAERCGPLVAPPTIVKHACRGFHIIPQKFSVKFPIRESFHAQVKSQ